MQRVIAHIVRTNPQYVAEHGQAGASTLAKHGYEMSRNYAIIAERDVVRLIELMALLGPDFDVNPKYPWARKILENQTLTPATRIDKLWKRSVKADPGDSVRL